MSETAGSISFHTPYNSTHFIRLVGYCVGPGEKDVIYFNPSATYVKRA